MTFVSLLARARRWAAYRRTVAELRAMPLDTALDLDLYHGDAEKIAARAIYGQNQAKPTAL